MDWIDEALHQSHADELPNTKRPQVIMCEMVFAY